MQSFCSSGKGLVVSMVFPFFHILSLGCIFVLWLYYWDAVAELATLLKLVRNSHNSEIKLNAWPVSCMCSTKNIVYFHLHILCMETMEQMQIHVYLVTLATGL